MLGKNSDAKTVAVQNLYIKFAPRLILFARKFVGSIAAEDIVQDVFVKLLNRNMYLNSEAETKSLLFIIVRNECIDHIRKTAYRTRRKDSLTLIFQKRELEFFSELDEGSPAEEHMARVMAMSEKLPQKRKEVFTEYYIKGKRWRRFPANSSFPSARWRTISIGPSIISVNCFKLPLFFI
ncbi:MAG: sigma-70 family RNA polymerase sigma factor [Rikenellaceae bacterium]|nr:sigma-70 family RNA polymerase sigma factor [Rikenellaceae bacterium]